MAQERSQKNSDTLMRSFKTECRLFNGFLNASKYSGSLQLRSIFLMKKRFNFFLMKI